MDPSSLSSQLLKSEDVDFAAESCCDGAGDLKISDDPASVLLLLTGVSPNISLEVLIKERELASFELYFSAIIYAVSSGLFGIIFASVTTLGVSPAVAASSILLKLETAGEYPTIQAM